MLRIKYSVASFSKEETFYAQRQVNRKKVALKAKSEENGKLVEKIDSTLLTLTDFSPPLG
jgi:hypothetical protein